MTTPKLLVEKLQMIKDLVENDEYDETIAALDALVEEVKCLNQTTENA